jgi:hypothetical protein
MNMKKTTKYVTVYISNCKNFDTDEIPLVRIAARFLETSMSEICSKALDEWAGEHMDIIDALRNSALGEVIEDGTD